MGEQKGDRTRISQTGEGTQGDQTYVRRLGLRETQQGWAYTFLALGSCHLCSAGLQPGVLSVQRLYQKVQHLRILS